jgi:flagellar protein FlbD
MTGSRGGDQALSLVAAAFRPPSAMIVVHRLHSPDHPLYVNPDLIQTVEANPDTVIALENASKFVVIERPEQVVELIRQWRASILARVDGGRVVPIRG